MSLLSETDDYDLIFAALKNPTRRQILLLLEQKGEATFTDIQNAINLTDTGLLSYHLKELGILVEQSSRGKYSLSEIGQTSMNLLNKVEKDKEQTKKTVQKEVGNYISTYVNKTVILACLIIVNLIVPLTVDIIASVQTITESIPTWQLATWTLVAFLGMLAGLVLFVVYDRHYYSKNMKTNLIHAAAFAAGISAVMLLTANNTIGFVQSTLATSMSTAARAELFAAVQWSIVIIRTTAYMLAALLIAYGFNKRAKKR